MNDTSGLSMRQPPANDRAEMALLGAILANNKAFHAVSSFLEPEHFTDPVHGAIFEACAKRIAAGSVADAVTMNAELAPILAPVGGTSYLTQLLTTMISIASAPSYGRAIREAWLRRRLIDLGSGLVEQAFDGSQEIAGSASDAMSKLMAAMDDTEGRKAVSLDEALDQALAEAERAYKTGGASGLSTGMPTVDKQLGFLRDATLNVLAARPGMGKTALAVKWGVSAARRGVGVLINSLEMAAPELGRRVLSEASGVPAWRMEQGQLNQRDFDNLVRAKAELRNLPMTIEDAPGQSAADIIAKAHLAKRRHGLGLVIVDHLQIVRTEASDDRAGNAVAVGRVSGATKRLAKEMNLPVLLLAQLSRAVEQREDKRPVLSDLRYSGDIEADADTVSFIYRGEYYHPKTPPDQAPGEAPAKHEQRVIEWQEARERLDGRAELGVSKNRGGATGTVDLLFDGPTTTFSEPAA